MRNKECVQCHRIFTLEEGQSAKIRLCSDICRTKRKKQKNSDANNVRRLRLEQAKKMQDVAAVPDAPGTGFADDVMITRDSFGGMRIPSPHGSGVPAIDMAEDYGARGIYRR